MADFPDTSFDHLPLAAKRRIDAVCARFERECQQGQPRLEDFLTDLPDQDRTVLVAELLLLDIEYRRKRGEAPRASDYLPRFPDQHDFLRHALPNTNKTETVAGNGPPQLGNRPPVQVPGYDMLEELGRGGMGVVFKARHLKLNRLVALKFIHAGNNATQKLRERFRREAEVVARLRHPNIVQIYDIGEAEGHCYLALEYAEGGSVRERLAGLPMEPRAAAGLLEPLARAVQHAHRQGIVHRDLKPANILLSAGGDSVALGNRPLPSYQPVALDLPAAPELRPPLSACTPKLTDFGLARMLDHSGPLSELGMAAGTPQYMAPEQARGTPDAGPSIDVWALGATLYELLTGRPPFRAATVRETVRLVKEVDPVPPSHLQPSVPRDLETICLKCLEKEPERRYPGARELAQDLRRFLDGEAIVARRRSLWKRFTRWARQRPLRAGLTLFALVGLVGTSLLLAMSLVRAHRGWEEAERSVGEARAGLSEQSSKTRDAQDAHQKAEAARRLAEVQAARLLLQQAQELGLRGEADRAVVDLLAGLRLVQRQEPLDRVFRANLDAWLPHVAALQEIVVVQEEPLFVAQGKDGRIASVGRDGVLRVVDRKGQLVNESAKHGGPLRFLTVSRDGGRVLLGEGTQAVLRDLSGSESKPLAHLHPVSDGVFGATIWTACADGVVREWDEVGRRLPRELRHPSAARRLAVSPDGQTLAVAQADGSAWLWDLSASPPVHRVLPHSRSVKALVFHPDGTRLFTASDDGVVRVQDWRLGVETGGGLEHSAGVVYLEPTADGERLLTVTEDDVTRTWDVGARRVVATFRGAGRLGSDGLQVVVPRGLEVRIHSLPRAVSRLANPGMRAATGPSPIEAFAPYPEGKKILLALQGRAWPREAKPGQDLLRPWRGRLPSGVTALAFSPDGKELAVGDDKGSVRIWNTTTEQPGDVIAPGEPVRALAYAGGDTLAVGGDRGGESIVYLIERKSGKKIGDPLPHPSPIRALSFTAKGDRLLVDGQTTAVYQLPATRVLSVRDVTANRMVGNVVVVGTRAGQVRCYLAQDGSAIAPVLTQPGPIVAVDLDPEGHTLLAASADGSVRLWDVTEAPRPLGPPLVVPRPILLARFDATERAVQTLSGDGTIRLWPWPRPVAGSLAEVERLVQVRTGWSAAGEAMAAREWHQQRDAPQATYSVPSQLDWLEAQASEAWGRGDLFAARGYLDRLLASWPNDRSLYRRRGVVLARLGRTKEALVDHKKAAGKPEALAAELEYGWLQCQLAGDQAAARWYSQLAASASER